MLFRDWFSNRDAELNAAHALLAAYRNTNPSRFFVIPTVQMNTDGSSYRTITCISMDTWLNGAMSLADVTVHSPRGEVMFINTSALVMTPGKRVLAQRVSVDGELPGWALPTTVKARDLFQVWKNADTETKDVTGKKFFNLNDQKDRYITNAKIQVPTWNSDSIDGHTFLRYVHCYVINSLNETGLEFFKFGENILESDTLFVHEKIVPLADDGQINPLQQQMRGLREETRTNLNEARLKDIANLTLITKTPTYAKFFKNKNVLTAKSTELQRAREVEIRLEREIRDWSAEVVSAEMRAVEAKRTVEIKKKTLTDVAPKQIEIKATLTEIEAKVAELEAACKEELKAVQGNDSLLNFMKANSIEIYNVVQRNGKIDEIELTVRKRVQVQCFQYDKPHYKIWIGPLRARLTLYDGAGEIFLRSLNKDTIVETAQCKMHPHQSPTDLHHILSSQWISTCGGNARVNLAKTLDQGSAYESLLVFWSWLTATDLGDTFGSTATRFPRVKIVKPAPKPVEVEVKAQEQVIAEQVPGIVAETPTQPPPARVPTPARPPRQAPVIAEPANPNNYVPVRRNNQAEQE